jgi:Flp pilus assembly protein TadG
MRGAASVEYAVTAIYWIAMTIAVIEFGRVMYMWTATYEATRLGARLAIVCGVDSASVKTRMQSILPILTAANINIAYAGTVCSSASCVPTSVTVSGVTVDTVIPLAPLSFPLPTATTSLPPETRRDGTSATCT